MRAFGRGALFGAVISGACVGAAELLHVLGVDLDNAVSEMATHLRTDALAAGIVSTLAGIVECTGVSPLAGNPARQNHDTH